MSLHTVEAADTFAKEHGKDETFIPDGMYCYSNLVITTDADGKPHGKAKLCPYWAMDPKRENQMNGYCAFLGSGDWEEEGGFTLLWDQVKECGVKDDLEHNLEDPEDA